MSGELLATFIPGRLPPHPEETHPRLHLGDHLSATLPVPPASVDWHSQISDWPMYGNDQEGDCVPAEMGHHEQVFSAYGSGSLVTVSDDAVLKVYEDVAGYVPGDPSTDNGTNIQDALSYWRKIGLAGHQIAAFAQVNVADMAEVQTALALFGPLSIGINLPRSAMEQFNAGEPWDVVTDDGGQLGGHCVAVVGFSGDGFTVVTWGTVQTMTAAFWKAYVEESWTPLSKEWVSAAGKDPEGVDLYGLGQEFTELTGQPNPWPAPAPQPVPPSPAPPPAPAPQPAPEGLLAELAALVREVAQDAERGIQHIVSWLESHGL